MIGNILSKKITGCLIDLRFKKNYSHLPQTFSWSLDAAPGVVWQTSEQIYKKISFTLKKANQDLQEWLQGEASPAISNENVSVNQATNQSKNCLLSWLLCKNTLLSYLQHL